MKFYIANILCSAFALLLYSNFRLGVTCFLRVKKKSRKFIKKNKKGYLNYWTYKSIHDKIGLGYIFYLNIILLVLTLLYTFVSVCFGWVKFLSLSIAICNALLCVAQIPAVIFSDIYFNLDYYNCKFVILAKSKAGRGFHSSFKDLIEIFALLAFAVYNITMAA